jgi:hypothetical protein
MTRPRQVWCAILAVVDPFDSTTFSQEIPVLASPRHEHPLGDRGRSRQGVAA